MRRHTLVSGLRIGLLSSSLRVNTHGERVPHHTAPADAKFCSPGMGKYGIGKRAQHQGRERERGGLTTDIDKCNSYSYSYMGT
jgi:hypothetical protein